LFDRGFQQILLGREELLTKILSIGKLERHHLAALRFLVNMCHQSASGQNYITSDPDFLSMILSNLVHLEFNEDEPMTELATLSVGLLVNLIEDNETGHNLISPHLPSLIDRYLCWSRKLHDAIDGDHREIFMSYCALLLLIMYEPGRVEQESHWRSLYDGTHGCDQIAALAKRVQKCLWIQQQMSHLHQNHEVTVMEKSVEPFSNASSQDSISFSSLSDGMRAKLVRNLKHLAERPLTILTDGD
jgi:hypothetical protein